MNKILLGCLIGLLMMILTCLFIFPNLDVFIWLLMFLFLFGVLIYTTNKCHPLFGDKKEQLMVFILGTIGGVFWVFGYYLSSGLFNVSIILFSTAIEVMAKKKARTKGDEELIDELQITILEKSAFKAIFSLFVSYIVFWGLSISAGLHLEISMFDASLLPIIILISQFIIFKAYYTSKFS